MEIDSSTHWIRGWKGLRARLDTLLADRKLLPRIEPLSVVTLTDITYSNFVNIILLHIFVVAKGCQLRGALKRLVTS